MGLLTSQQISNYYDIYRDTEVTFTKEVIKTLRLDPRQVCIRCAGTQWPCIINSTSFQAAKIIIGARGGAFAQISKEGTPVNLRFFFASQDNQPVIFYVNARVASVAPYMTSNDLAVVSLAFTQRPPDDLIEAIGQLLEANINSTKRREERIVITPDSKRRLSLVKEETICFVQGVPRHCIVRDLSFSGAKIILVGLPNFIVGKDTVLRLDFEDPRETIGIQGKVVKAEFVEGRKDLVAVSIMYIDGTVSMSYKIHINNYLTVIRKKQLDVVASQEQREKIAASVRKENKKTETTAEKKSDSPEEKEAGEKSEKTEKASADATEKKETPKEPVPENGKSNQAETAK